MTKTLWRWYYAARTFRNYGTSLNRRAEVESVLLNIANGKRPLLTPDECRALASKLAGGK
jgi:hypothetical protein